MDELSKEYCTLFNGISGTILEMEAMIGKLKMLQLDAERIYISRGQKPAGIAPHQRSAEKE